MTKDEEEIRALIDANRIAVWTQDFAAYEKCFVHAPYLTRFHASRFMGIFVRQGWDDIAARMRRHFANKTYLNAANAHEAKVENLKLHIHGNIAWEPSSSTIPASSPNIRSFSRASATKRGSSRSTTGNGASPSGR